MSSTLDEVENALLHEGHLLYPYDARALKNRHRWLFGRLYPEAWCRARGGAEASSLATECLVVGGDGTEVSVRVRFLQIAVCEPESGEALRDAIPQDVDAGAGALGALISGGPMELPFGVPATCDVAPGTPHFVRRTEALRGVVELEAALAQPGVFKLRLRVRNATGLPDGALLDEDGALRFTLVSAHAALAARRGAFVSLRDPPPELAELARGCRHERAWPILVGAEGARDAMLCSPIILDDYPRVAPESPGDRFDAVEIDELLTLSILALTDEEKQAMAADERARAVLQRTETMTAEERSRLHGRLSRARGRGRAAT